MKGARILAVLALWCLVPAAANAGGPLAVGGPNFGVDGVAFTWDAAKMPIQYRVDPGPLAVNGTTTVVSNATGLSRLQAAFAVWQAVPTAAISFQYAGPLLATGSYVAGQDVTTVTQFNDLSGSCQNGAQSPVIFDADSSLLKALGLPPEVIGFAGPCAMDAAGHINAAFMLLNGSMQDGVSSRISPPNFEISTNQFDEVMVHEAGHFVGLDHSQINVDVMQSLSGTCDGDTLAGLPVMFPELVCQAHVDAGLPPLTPDDTAAISVLYPSARFATSYGTISGRIYFSDGVGQVQGANVIARALDDPSTAQDESRRLAYSVVSGYLFTGNPGQSVTAVLGVTGEDNSAGSRTGSRDPQLIGYYKIAVPPGTYTVQVESIYSAFAADSSIGPLPVPAPLPGAAEYWNQYESAFDFPLQQDTIDVSAGSNITGIDIILNGTPPRFDQFEDPGVKLEVPALRPTSAEARG